MNKKELIWKKIHKIRCDYLDLDTKISDLDFKRYYLEEKKDRLLEKIGKLNYAYDNCKEKEGEM